MYPGRVYFEEGGFKLIENDTFDTLKQLEEKSFDMIFADPPYFLSDNGITCNAGKMVSVNKGEWDKSLSIEKKHKFNKRWIHECYRVLKDEGTIWISGTLHNIYSIGMALEEEGFKIINNITWQKTNPPPNLACKTFTHSTETILWARKNLPKTKYKFNYELMKELNNNKQMKDVWESSLRFSYRKNVVAASIHPSLAAMLVSLAKPYLKENAQILDPFCGSSTTGISANKLNRRYVGIDNSKEYLDLSIRRYEAIKEK